MWLWHLLAQKHCWWLNDTCCCVLSSNAACSLNGWEIPLKMPLSVRKQGPHLIVVPWAHTSPHDVFAGLTLRVPYTLLWAGPFFTPKLPPVGSVPPPNTWFLGPTRVHAPNGTSIGSVVFAGHTVVISRKTEWPRYDIYNNRLHLHDTHMQCCLIMLNQ